MKRGTKRTKNTLVNMYCIHVVFLEEEEEEEEPLLIYTAQGSPFRCI